MAPKNLRPLNLVAVLVGVMLAATLPANAGTLAVGDSLPALAGKDQHEKDYAVAGDTKWVMIAFDMGTGKAANRWLGDQGADYLPEHGAVFVSNIHGMPGVGRMFALPKMRKYPHRILLADKEGLLDSFPTEKNRVTVLKLKEDGTIEAITFWDPDAKTAPF